MLQTLAYVALGGAVGSVARYLVGQVVAFPVGTLTVNVVGSFAIGIFWATQIDKASILTPLVMIGVLGGFTTFSTFSLDVLRLVETGRFGAAGAYVIASVTFSLLACYVGMMLGPRGAV